MMVSFIMPAYKAAYLAEAIGSIIAQTYGDWELVVVDDCSPEGLEPIVRKFDDPRIRYHRNERNIGGENLVRQWNHSLGFARGDWVVLAADDDLYAPGFCAGCLALASKYPQVDLIRSRVLQIDENGAPLWDDGVLAEFTNKYEYLHDWLTAKAFTCIGNFMFRRSTLSAIGGFIDFPCAFGSDIATPIALSLNGVANTSEMLFRFRQSSTHLSADSGRFKDKLAGITQLSQWIASLDYGEPGTEEDRAFYAVHDPRYLHAKCIYDYFNLVIRHVPFKDLPAYLRQCRLATPADKLMMVARWLKRKIDG